MEIVYRKSKTEDKNLIHELISLRFGNRDYHGVCDNLENRYLLAFDGETLIAMTGLNDSNFYNGLALDWTCVRKEYEGNGIVSSMVKKCINEGDNYKKDIYASCWKLGENSQINLVHCMTHLSFKPIVYRRILCNSKYNNCKDICINYKEGCWCCEDLYLRKGGKKA